MDGSFESRFTSVESGSAPDLFVFSDDVELLDSRP